MNETKIILKMEDVCKSFNNVMALSNVNFNLCSGEIHALMGENGAGKSTLIKVLTGVEKLDSGKIYFEGKLLYDISPIKAREIGISTVYQEINLCQNLSVAENIFIGHEIIRNGVIDWKEINKKAEEILKSLNLKIDVTKKLGSYSVAIQQMVAIARALEVSAKIMILDEPTSSLDENEVKLLFDVMRKLKNDGLGIIFVTHFIDQVYEICDRVTILRNGNLVGEYDIDNLPKVQLIAKMIGKDLEELSGFNKNNNIKSVTKEEGYFIKADGVGHNGSINPMDLNIKKDEVLGFAGLLGSGRTETANILFGIDRADEGEIYMNDKKVTITSPTDAIKLGIALCPEDRKTDGIIADLSVRENITLALQSKMGFKKLSKKAQKEITDNYIKILDIKTPDDEQLVKNLSGGNQQKVILARWLATSPELLILDEPTRGIDVGVKTEIQKLVIKLAKEGMAVIFISSELDEVLRCSTRVVVFKDRNKIAELVGENVNEKNVMGKIAGEELRG